MTNPGEDAGETASSDSSTAASEPESAGYEAPPIESAVQPEPTPNRHPTTRDDAGSRRRRPSSRRTRRLRRTTRPQRRRPDTRHRGTPLRTAIRRPASRRRLSAARSARLRAPPYPDPSSYGAPAYPPPPAVRRLPATDRLPGSRLRRRLRSARAETNSLAIASLVASGIGILPFICGLGSIIGIVLGVVALNQIKTSGEGGRGLAIAGIAVGA